MHHTIGERLLMIFFILITVLIIFIVGVQTGIHSAHMRTARGEVTPVLDGDSYKLEKNTKLTVDFPITSDTLSL